MRFTASLLLGLFLACSVFGQNPSDVGIEVKQVTRILAANPVLVEKDGSVAIYSSEFNKEITKGILIKATDEANLLIRFQRLNEFPKVAEKIDNGLFFVEGKSGEKLYVEVISFSPENGFKFYGETFEIDTTTFCGDDPVKPDPVQPEPIDPELPPPPDEIAVVDTVFFDNIKNAISAVPISQKTVFDKVAANFETAARKAISGDIKTNQELWSEVSRLNLSVISKDNLRFWDSFGVSLQVEINVRIRNKKIEDSAKGRAPYLLMVAKALREAK